MLKLMKYEFIHSMRTFLLSFIVFLGACIIYPILTVNVFEKYDALFTSGALIFLLINFSMIALVIGILIALSVSIVINFNRSMFKRPAYLTLTLPVSSRKLIFSKVLMSVIWLIIGTAVLLLGMGIASILMTYLQSNMTILTMITMISNYIKMVTGYMTGSFSSFMGDVFLLLGSLIFSVGTIYFSLTAVHTKWCRKYRLLCGIVLYIAINIVVTVVMGKLMPLNIQYELMPWINGGYQMIFGVLFIYGTVYLFDHQIEIQ